MLYKLALEMRMQDCGSLQATLDTGYGAASPTDQPQYDYAVVSAEGRQPEICLI